MDEPIYHEPKLYDLEHAKAEPDVGFYLGLAREWHPRRILELGCGTGRITLPLASATRAAGSSIVGLDIEPAMLETARQKSRQPDFSGAERVEWLQADLRRWRAPDGFDVILAPCGTLTHLLDLEDQLAAWRASFRNLNPGGRFVADVAMAALPSFAESMQHPPRALLEWDRDTSLPGRGEHRRRLLRCKAVLYHAATQRAETRFFYDQLKDGDDPERFLSDYEHHVYYPRELELLFRIAGFQIEAVWGDYAKSPLRDDSRNLIMVGVKSTSTESQV